MAVTPELTPDMESQFAGIANGVLSSGETSMDAFYNAATKAGLRTNPRANKLFAEARSKFLSKPPVVSTEDVQNEINQTDSTIKDYTSQQQQKQQNKVAQDLFNKENSNKQIDETINTYDNYLDSELKATQDTFDSLYAEVGSATDTLIQTLKDQYALRTDEMKVTNKAALNTKSISLGRSGAKRYASEQATGVLSAEEAAGINRIKSLAVEEAQLIAEAKLAKTKEQWKMFTEKRQALTDLNDKKVTALKDQLDLINKVNTISDTEAKSALEKLQLSAQSGADLDTGLMNQIDSLYGDGFSVKYANMVNNAQVLKEAGDDVKLAQDTIDLLLDIPVGQSITLFGETYQGMATTEPNIQTWIKTTATGEYKVIKFNEDTNEVTVTGTGEKEKPTGTGTGGVKNILGLETIVIDGKTVPKDFEGHFGDDGKVDTDTYKNTRNQLKSASDRTLFDENYRYLLNPSDPTAVDLALPKTFNDEQQAALEAALGENWISKSAKEKLDALTEYEKNKRKELGIGQNSSNSVFGNSPFQVTTST